MPVRTHGLQHLSSRIQALARFYQLRRKDNICRHGITVSQCYALETLTQSTSTGVTALATALGINKSSASRVVDSLCEAGLAAWESLPNDARTKRVAPTRAGRTLAARIHRDIEAEHARTLHGFTLDELETCGKVLTALIESKRYRS